ncbi:hypothetical protein [Campylobacter concisus]|uniref:hypothetical protein n=1 Tax=Campylobacter concisus TaxID=199 RepID=UPI00112FCF58|nr:hypothetical protein [Campylobacter concisus]
MFYTALDIASNFGHVSYIHSLVFVHPPCLKQKFSCLGGLNLFVLSSVENFFVVFKIITRYFTFIFGCQILKFTYYLNLLQNTADQKLLLGFCIFKLSFAFIEK